jgi:trehalose synthase-fused probable maltokinase
VRPEGTLTAALPEYLPRCRWFGDKARTIRRTRIVETWWLPSGASRASLNLVRVSFARGAPGTYLVPTALASGAHAAAIRERRPEAVIVDLGGAGRAGPQPELLFDAASDPSFWRCLFEWFASGRRLSGARGSLVPRLLPAFGALRGSAAAALEPRPLREEQSNSSVVLGDRLVLKLLRRLDAGVSPEVEMGAVLTARGFTHSPALAGHLEYHPARGQPITVATLHQYVPNDGDAWRRARQEVAGFLARMTAWRRAGGGRRVGADPDVIDGSAPAVAEAVGPYLGAVTLLGRRVAEMHLTLSEDTDDADFAPERYAPRAQQDEGRAMQKLARYALGLVRTSRPGLRGAARLAARHFLRAEPRVLTRLHSFVEHPISVARIRGHGDLHLGQVLHAGADFVIIDFEGEPARPLAERRRKSAALRDVAGMLRSFHYAAFSELEEQIASGVAARDSRPTLDRWANAWHASVRGAFLRGYLKTAGPSIALVPRDEDELRLLLDVFQLEKAIYEVAYEANHRPAWLPIPLHGVVGLV